MNKRTSPVLVFILCMPLFVTACWSAPGEGRKARAGYKAAEPVIVALEKFRKELGHYPTNLCQLVPDYLSDANALHVRHEIKPLYSPRSEKPASQTVESASLPFSYRVEGDDYDLSFEYIGPGVNTCFYSSRTGRWSANGYY